MAKEVKILFTAILTMVFFGGFLLLEGTPFFVFPLNCLINFIMVFAIMITLKRFDRHNILMLVAALLLLLQDPTFWSFFVSSRVMESEVVSVLRPLMIALVVVLSFVSMLTKDKNNILLVSTGFFLSMMLVSRFQLIGLMLAAIVGLLIAFKQKDERIYFLRVYWVFYLFMSVNQVFTLNFYN